MLVFFVFLNFLSASGSPYIFIGVGSIPMLCGICYTNEPCIAPYHLVGLVPLMLDSVEVDVGNWLGHTKCTMEVNLARTVQINPPIGHWVRTL